MQVINGLTQLPALKNPVITIGSFDGVHLGHQRIFDHLKKEAKRLNGSSVAITFNPHPQQLLHPDSDFFLIHPIDEKIKLIEKEGIDYLILLPFTTELASMSFSQFLKDILIEKIGIKALVMGPNHSFGKNREGNSDSIAKLCKEENIEVLTIPEFSINDCAVRSTKIRKFIANNEKEKATEFLGRDI